MILETKRLILRPWEESDAQDLYEYAKDPKVGPAAGWPVHTSVENSREIIKTALSAPDTYAVVLKESGKVVGSIGLMRKANSNLHIEDQEGEIGYWIGVPYWGMGYIPEAVKRLQEYAFEEAGIETLWCAYYDGNEKSKRVMEKCGFRYHHTIENVPCPLIDDVRTEHVMVLYKKDWKNA